MSRRLTVAVVIATIPGREKFLNRALESVKQQDWFPDQIVVERDSERTGAWAARNRALARIRPGIDAVAWLDDDDWLKPEHLKVCMRELAGPMGYSLVYPRPIMVDGKDPTATTFQGRFPVSPWGLRFTKESEHHMRTHGSFIPMTHVVMTEAVREIGGFQSGYMVDTDGRSRYRGEDEDYLLRLLDAGYTFGHVDRKTWYWQVHTAHTAGKSA